jgi:sugar phosphate isomerase/epimerase
VFQGIDVVPALQAIGSRVHLIHAKDTKLDRRELPLVGHFGDWWTYCLPGRGEIDWSGFLRAVHEVGYAGTIVIEHEDADFGWPNGTLEARRQGLLLARASLEEAFSSVYINPAAPAN